MFWSIIANIIKLDKLWKSTVTVSSLFYSGKNLVQTVLVSAKYKFRSIK